MGSKRWRRVAAATCASIVALPLTACGGDDHDGVPTINFYSAPEQNLQQVVDECTAAAGGRYEIDYRVLPREADNQRVQMVRRLAAGDTGMDVLGLDVTWTQELASAEWIREWTGEHKARAEQGTLAGPLETARYEGKLFAAPKNTNVQLLWYRTDLVPEPPGTWDEMIEAALRLKAQGKTYQILTMGARYEGLTVLFNTLVKSAGGRILNEDGDRVVLDEGAVQALELLKRFATAGVTSPSFSNATEDPVRLAFQSGEGAFQLNWPYVYPAMQADAPQLAQRVAWARYPRVEPDMPSRVTIGGINLAISTFSEHPQEAFEAALCIRNSEHQLYSAIKDGVPPTIESVYAQPQMQQAYPMKETILAELKDAAVRPTTPAYQGVSTVISAILSPPDMIQPQETVDDLRDQVDDALNSRGVLP